MKSMGISMISLYTRVPSTNRAKPTSSPTMKVSVPASRKMSQMTRVLLVSMVDLYAAEAYFVIIIPVMLNPEIVMMLHSE